jgi:hypothetical protein
LVVCGFCIRSVNIHEKLNITTFLGDRCLVGKPIGEEIRDRFPRLTMSLVMAIIFYLVNTIVPPLIEDTILPGINVNAGMLVGTIALIFTAIFLIRALSDGLVLSDILTDIFVKRLGIKEERSPRRAMRDTIYIIVIILITTALYPVINTLEPGLKDPLLIGTTYVALGIILILIYDIGRILYRIVERKAENMADSFAKMTDRMKNRE